MLKYGNALAGVESVSLDNRRGHSRADIDALTDPLA